MFNDDIYFTLLYGFLSSRLQYGTTYLCRCPGTGCPHWILSRWTLRSGTWPILWPAVLLSQQKEQLQRLLLSRKRFSPKSARYHVFLDCYLSLGPNRRKYARAVTLFSRQVKYITFCGVQQSTCFHASCFKINTTSTCFSKAWPKLLVLLAHETKIM
jgi:hypothetical protein